MIEVILISILIIGVLIVIFLLLKKPDSLLMLQQQMNQVTQTLDTKLTESGRSMQTQFQESSKIIKEVTEKLTRLDETNKQVMGFAGQLQSLENILKNPKQRGILGEFYLEELLKNVFNPKQYQMQYKFKDGDIVDAVIFLDKDKIVPIDSKFSLENYNRIIKEEDDAKRGELEKAFRSDLKNRIDETSKYIKPEEGTLDFALMFIPSEAIYYDLLVNEVGAIKASTRDLLEYANKEKNVHIVSPTTFYAYLQTILRGLRAFQIEKAAMEIRKNVEKMERHLLSYDQYMQRLGKHMETSCSTYNKAYKEFGKINKDVLKITKGDSEVEVKQINYESSN